MIWLARFLQISSGLIIAYSAHETSVVGAMIGWFFCTLVPMFYALAEKDDSL